MQKCGRSVALDGSYAIKNTIHFTLAKILKEVLKTVELTDSKAEIVAKVKAAFAAIGTDDFINAFSVVEYAENMAFNIFRWTQWAEKRGHKIVERDLSFKVLLEGKIRDVKADMLIETAPDTYHLIKFSNGKPKYTLKKSNQTYVGKAEEAFYFQKAAEIMQMRLAKSLGKAVNVIPAFYSMKAAGDKTRLKNVEFEAKACENVVSFKLNKDEMRLLRFEINNFKPNVSDCSGTCSACKYNNLCNMQFVPRTAKPKPKKVIGEASRITLSAQQQAIVNATEGFIQVNAVAGSGKTTVITIRALTLLEDMLDNDEEDKKILMVTFTDKAAGGMKDDIKKWYKAFYGTPMPAELAEMIEVGTFNSWGHTLICKHYKELGFTAEPVVVDDKTRKKIVEKLLEEFPAMPLDYMNPTMDLPFAKGCIIEMVNLMSAFKSAHVESPADVLNLKKDWRKSENVWFGLEKVAYDFYVRYNEELFAQNCIDYEDQLRLLPKLRDIGVFKDLPYTHITIDEYQDSDANQIAIIKAITEDCKNVKSLAVVGDVMQSIYSFRNTSPENILNFGRDFRGAKYFELSTNYRSSEQICNYANAQIANDPDINKATRLVPSRGKIHAPLLYIMDKQSEGIVAAIKKIEEWKADGRPLEEMAIVARNKSELLEIQTALEAAGIHSTLKVPEVVSQNPYVQAMFGLNSFLRDGDESGLALYIKSLGKDPFNFNEVKAEGKKLMEEIDVLPSMPEKINYYMAKLQDISKNDFVAEKFFESLKRSTFKTIKDLYDELYEYEYYSVKDTVNETAENAGVTLITVHSSKGLEYKNVILFIDKIKETAEEKRILYVGVTRAQDDLMIVADKKQRTLLNLLNLKPAS